LQQLVIGQGEVAQREYAEFAEWCETRARDLGHELSTGKASAAMLKSSAEESAEKIAALTARVEELAESIASDEEDLQKATTIRDTERSDFLAAEKELMDIIGILRRAAVQLERDAAKNSGSSLLQTRSTGDFVQALSAMVQASLIDGADGARLTAFVQAARGESDDLEQGAPSASTYDRQDANILEVLQDLQEKAEDQLEAARKKEVAAAQNFELRKQALDDEIRFAKRDMEQAKKGIASYAEKKSTAEGELQKSTKDLVADGGTKSALRHECMAKAEDFATETKSRAEELKALAAAKQMLQEVVSGSASDDASFLQLRAAEPVGFGVLRQVRVLARRQRSAELAQLATQMASALHGRDPFAKVEALLADMLAKLQEAAGMDATRKAHCDKELNETAEKKSDKSDDIEKLATSIDVSRARSSKLKEEVAALQSALARLAKSQQEADRLRQEEHTAFLASKAETEKALTLLRSALRVLKEYYGQEAAHEDSEGGASGIIGLIEVCESLFEKSLADITSEEEAAAAEYTAVSKANDIEKAAKEKDVAYKVQESTMLDKTLAEESADRDRTQAELDALLEYQARLQGDCSGTAESYEERKSRRAAEIAGLRAAQATLEGETALLQRGVVHQRLRGRQRVLRAA